MKRIFIVGFARSGTSLLHSIVAAYPSVYGFTESSYFFHKYVSPLECLPITPHFADKFCLPRLFAASKLDDVLDEFMSENLIEGKLLNKGDFISILDDKCSQMGCDAWVEKSTVHLRRIPVIKKRAPDAKFIHIIRRFPAVLRSWQFASGSLGLDFFAAPENKIFRYWKRDLARTVQYVTSDPKHHMAISYQSLCNDTEKVIKKLNLFIEKEASFGDINGKRSRTGVVLARESWKDNVRLGIHQATGFDLSDKESTTELFYNNAVMSLIREETSCL